MLKKKPTKKSKIRHSKQKTYWAVFEGNKIPAYTHFEGHTSSDRLWIYEDRNYAEYVSKALSGNLKVHEVKIITVRK